MSNFKHADRTKRLLIITFISYVYFRDIELIISISLQKV